MHRTTHLIHFRRYLRIAGLVLLTIVPAGARLAAANPQALPGAQGTVWATNRGTHTVAAFDAATGAEIKNIPVGRRPIGVVAPEGTGKVYSSDEGSAQVSVISKASLSVVKVIPLPGLLPHHLVASSDGRYVYVAGWSTAQVAVIDTATDTVTGMFVTSTSPGARTHAVDLTADDTILLATNSVANELAVLDARTGERLWRLPVGVNPSEVLADRWGKLAYVSIRDEDQVEVVDLEQRRVITEIDLGADQPDTLQLTPNGQMLVVGMRDTTAAKVVTVDVGHDDHTEVITMDEWRTTGHNWLSANGRYTFIAVEAKSVPSAPPAIAVIDHRTQELVATYPYPGSGAIPHGVFYERSQLTAAD